jgi:copper resistance protein B
MKRSLALPTLALLAATLGGAAHAAELDGQAYTAFQLDRFERRIQDGEDLLAWDARATLGSDAHKLALLAEGAYGLDQERTQSAEWQLRYQRPLTDFFDAHVGLRHDARPRPDRTYLVAGIGGLAPQWLEVEASLFLSDEGKASTRLEAEYDLLLTQRLALQLDGELNLAFARDLAIGQGSGLNGVELGLRLRYEVTREIAPYVGVVWERAYGETSDLAAAAGDDREITAAVVGITLSF